MTDALFVTQNPMKNSCAKLGVHLKTLTVDEAEYTNFKPR